MTTAPKPMSYDEEDDRIALTLAVRSALSTLRLARCRDEDDIRVAMARLDHWLGENDGRWIK